MESLSWKLRPQGKHWDLGRAAHAIRLRMTLVIKLASPSCIKKEFEELMARVVDLKHQNALLTVMVEEMTRQIEMLTRILNRLPST